VAFKKIMPAVFSPGCYKVLFQTASGVWEQIPHTASTNRPKGRSIKPQKGYALNKANS